MMISPNGYINMIKDKKYKELLVERNKLLKEIKNFEKEDNEAECGIEIKIHPSPEVVYQMNLLYLAKLCELLSEKYSLEFIHNN